MWLRPGSPRPRRRRISVSVSALRICSSMSGRVSGRIAGTEETAEVEVTAEEDAEEFGTAATAAAPRALALFPSSPDWTPKISCTTSSTIPRAPPNSTRSWRTDAKACAATAGLRSSFVPVAPMDRNGQFAAHDRAPRRGNCSAEPTTPRPLIQSRTPQRRSQRRECLVGRLLVNRATARFILRSRCAGSKGYTPACHDVNKLADSPWPFFASSASQRQLSLSCSDFFSAFLCELCVKSFDSAFPHQAKLPRTTFRVLSYWPELGRAVYRRPHSSAAY